MLAVNLEGLWNPVHWSLYRPLIIIYAIHVNFPVQSSFKQLELVHTV
jgi:hypothetical protein